MSLVDDYTRVRRHTLSLLDGLGLEDCMVQAMPDVSPPKWHLAHTSWFFETFILEQEPGYSSPSPLYRMLFNSYYEAVGPKHPRPARGQLSRPTLDDVLAYRAHVDDAMLRRMASTRSLAEVIELGLHHEQQHQELLVMDVVYNFAQNPLKPAYREETLPRAPPAPPLRFRGFPGGLVTLGAGEEGFAFDNERPAHQRYLQPFELATRLVTNREMQEFIEAGGYQTASLWLADGWSWLRENAVDAPLYWRRSGDGSYVEFTAQGEVPLDPNAPVCHVSAYEAAAFAAWAGARLPTEFEWELAASGAAAERASAVLRVHPRGAGGEDLEQMFGELWQWTRSAYEPYPGFSPAPSAVGEYNGKFMCGQWVLRGGSVATPKGHVRSTYRNFFYPHQRWPFTGIRLAREAR